MQFPKKTQHWLQELFPSSSKKAKVCQLKSGVVEGTYYDAKGIEMIATIPSRDELIAKFMGSIQSPIANFARVINQIAEQKGGDAPAEEAAE